MRWIILSVFFIFAISVISCYALAQENISSQLNVSADSLEINLSLIQAENDMAQMIDAGLHVISYNDTLSSAKQIYAMQLLLENNTGNADYSAVTAKIDELKQIKLNAYKTLDEINALESSINQLQLSNATPAIDLYNQAREAFNSERYADSLALIDSTYKKISELEASQTKIKLFYEATSRSIYTFIISNWEIILIVIGASAIIIFLTYNRFMILLINRKMANLEIKRDSITNLIAKTQKEYFEETKTPESTYRIRTSKYGELIRDINRQIPLFKEELEMRKSKKNAGHIHQRKK